MALYTPHSIFHLAWLLYVQAGNFWTLLHIILQNQGIKYKLFMTVCYAVIMPQQCLYSSSSSFVYETVI